MLCGRVPAANAPGCTAAEGLLYKPWFLVVLLTPPGVSTTDPSSERRNYLGEKWRGISTESCDFHVTFRDPLHAVNLRHGTNGFTSLPKEGVLRIFSPWKNPTASAGFDPANLGTKGQHATFRPPKPLIACGSFVHIETFQFQEQNTIDKEVLLIHTSDGRKKECSRDCTIEPKDVTQLVHMNFWNVSTYWDCFRPSFTVSFWSCFIQ